MKIRVLNMGRTATGFVKDGVDSYLEKLSRYHEVEWTDLASPKAMENLPVPMQLKKEEEVYLRQLKSGSNVFLLDSTGKEYDSMDFARFVGKRISAGTSPLVLVTGGPYGFSEGMRNLAEGKLSFSKMTFTHQMIRLILAEQLYRAFSIMRNERYHH